MTSMMPTRVALAVSCLIALAIGSALLWAPISFYEMSGVTIPSDTSLLNDLRAYGGGVFAAGIFVGAGVFYRPFALPCLAGAGILYIGYGAARLWSIAVDGIPEAAYLWAMAIEIGVAVICASLAAAQFKNAR